MRILLDSEILSQFVEWRSSPERILCTCVKGKQELEVCIIVQHSYNSEVSILLVSLLSHASGSLRTTPFHFFFKCFYTCYYLGGRGMEEGQDKCIETCYGTTETL